MNTFIELISTEQLKDDEGFVNSSNTVLTSLRAYKKDRHGNKR